MVYSITISTTVVSLVGAGGMDQPMDRVETIPLQVYLLVLFTYTVL